MNNIQVLNIWYTNNFEVQKFKNFSNESEFSEKCQKK